MYEQQKKKRIARIIEVAIPMSIWDMFQDLLKEYQTPERVIIESIKAHHRQLHGSLEDITKPVIIAPTPNINNIQLSITDGKIAKMAENSRKIDRITQKKLEKIDELLEKVRTIIETKADTTEIQKSEEKVTQTTLKEEQNEPGTEDISKLIQQLKDLPALKDISREIQSMKIMLKRLESSGFSGGIRRRRADLSSLDLTITEAKDADIPLSPPERPLLETVLDSVLLFDDSDEEENTEKENENKKEKEKKDNS